MAQINAYTASKMESIMDDTVQSATVTGSKPNQYLRLVMKDGSIQNIGPITGDQGPQGAQGSGLGEVQTALASIVPTTWTAMPFDPALFDTSGFIPYGYSGFRYRVLGDTVEFNGSCAYIGAGGITTCQVCPFNTLAADMWPTSSGQYRVITGQRYSTSGAFYEFPCYIAGSGAFTLFQYSGPNLPALQPGDYVTFNGCSYHK